MDPGDSIGLAASVEQDRRQPLAAAILAEALQRQLTLTDVTDSTTVPGLGVVAQLDGHTIHLGSDAWLAQANIATDMAAAAACKLSAQGQTLVYVALDQQLVGLIAIADRPRDALADESSGYEALIGPGNMRLSPGDETLAAPKKLPQMPSYHLTRPGGAGITLVNIGVGPSNAKTATDHIAVLRPHVWQMVGHCAGLRTTQSLGDYVLAHAYLREDKVLDDDLPVWVPIPALAEVQIALEEAVADISQLEGFELKRIMRTGTVATVDNRNWELRDQSGPVQRLSQSRAVALDMESATIAANGFRFRVPYGTLLCVSDKPLHGELKLPGMASAFYTTQVSRHLHIGIRAMEKLREMSQSRLHSRKLRSFEETAFL